MTAMRILLPAILLLLGHTAWAAPTLSDVGCHQEGRLHSISGTTPTKVTFINSSDRPIRTYWLNYTGKRVYYAEVLPGQRYTQETFVTHPWLITDSPSGECRAVFQPVPHSGTVVYEAPAE